MWDDLWGNLGDSEWWFGENSMFGEAMGTIGKSGINFSLFGQTKPPKEPEENGESMEADILKYGIIGIAAYMIISPTLK